jgi:hypothetical protein
MVNARRETEGGDCRRAETASAPQSLGIENSEGVVVEGKIDLDDPAMLTAGGGRCRRTVTALAEGYVASWIGN